MTQAQNYLKLESLLHATQARDSSYQAALYLLSTDTELTNAAARYTDGDGIDFCSLKKAALNVNERTGQLIDVAHNLFSWNSACTVTPFDLSRLGYPMLDQVCKRSTSPPGRSKCRFRSGTRLSPAWSWMTAHISKAFGLPKRLSGCRRECRGSRMGLRLGHNEKMADG